MAIPSHAVCKSIVAECSPSYHAQLKLEAIRVNAQTGAYYDEALCGFTWFTCARRACGQCIVFIEGEARS